MDTTLFGSSNLRPTHPVLGQLTHLDGHVPLELSRGIRGSVHHPQPALPELPAVHPPPGLPLGVVGVWQPRAVGIHRENHLSAAPAKV